MDAAEIAPDLWRWTGIVESAGKEAAAVYLKSGTTIVLVDPILPPEDEQGFWRALDRDVRPIGASVHVLLTTPGHLRQTSAMLARYEGARLWVDAAARSEVETHVEVTDVFTHGDPLPGGVTAFSAGRRLESLFWIAEHGTLVVGDALAGSNGRLELRAPEAAVARALRALPVGDVRRVLPSHGPPVLEDAAGELARVLGAQREP